ncbi:signal peptidase I [Fodinicola feengrottensis]|uniref:signal peptidase I n=1 Tax=Fodinicola feengrottensis TaxID=435914 RepID=UPI0013D50AF3|nr:signal peptidase I [Fodinicola feengrottensis]
MAATRRWALGVLIVACVVMLVVVAAVVGGLASYRAFTVLSASMGPTLQLNDRILVRKQAGAAQRGEIVIFTAPPSWGVSAQESTFPKRVIGIGGDHVKCCDAAGKVSVNGYALTELYLYPVDVPSMVPFDVRVPKDRIFLLGDIGRSRATRAFIWTTAPAPCRSPASSVRCGGSTGRCRARPVCRCRTFFFFSHVPSQ